MRLSRAVNSTSNEQCVIARMYDEVSLPCAQISTSIHGPEKMPTLAQGGTVQIQTTQLGPLRYLRMVETWLHVYTN